jgi:hypothetical protein
MCLEGYDAVKSEDLATGLCHFESSLDIATD